MVMPTTTQSKMRGGVVGDRGRLMGRFYPSNLNLNLVLNQKYPNSSVY